jgi:cytochrome c oxidase cbb3-type subunit 4
MTMDVTTLRSVLTLICFIVFLCIMGWAWSGRNRSRFHEAARVPLDDDDTCDRPPVRSSQR